MAISGGIACSTAPANGIGGGSTAFNIVNTITANGTLTHWCFKAGGANGSSSVKLKVFRDNGTNYDFVGESSSITPTSSGIWEGYCDIPVQAGDFIGLYATAGEDYPFTDNGDVNYPKTQGGDITTNTAKTAWSDAWYGQIIIHADDASILDVYIDINKADDAGAGTSWATAKKTMKAGWDILNTLGTMHVATGNYSAQTGITYNKSWKLSPEDPNTTGEKRVAIPPSV